MDVVRATRIPVIETRRLILRPLEVEEFDDYSALWADPVVTRFIGGRPHTRDEAWGRFLRHIGTWSVFGYGFWGVEHKATGRLVGEAGFQDLKRAMQPSIEGLPEAGWCLLPDTHGQGLATEAVEAVTGWSDANLPAPRTVCIIDPDNLASLRVAEKCGYREVARIAYRDKPTVLLER
jgi:RimJ/RimL family protein N-acetyltransferase